MSIWPFSRKPKPLNPGPINEDWAPGDLAECILDGHWVCVYGINSCGPEKGDVFQIVRVEMQRSQLFPRDSFYLQFKGDPNSLWAAETFRKLPPYDSKCDTEFAETIKGLKPKWKVSSQSFPPPSELLR